MKSLLRPVCMTLFAALFCFLAVDGVLAQSYPSKPIRCIVTWPPGGAVDIIARIIGQKLTESWGQPVVVDNRPGATGIIGMDIGAKAAPDGYTIIVTALHVITLNPNVFKKLPHDVIRDFAPVALLARSQFVLLVHPSVPAKSVQEFIALAKSKPGQINYGSIGLGSSFHLSMEMLKSMAGIDMTHVPYKGSAPSLTALVSGEVSAAFDQSATALPYIKAGKLRALAVTGPKRSPEMPDLPTMVEAGVPGYEATGGFGALAPAKTPKEIVTKLNAEIMKILHMPDVKERFFGFGLEILDNTPEQFAAIIKAEIAKWAKVVKEANIQPVD
jgi:tripartite-type tricarboxylate transporter receptor subunit TctC